MQKSGRCPVCQSSSSTTFLIRKEVPVHQNLVMRDKRSAMKIQRGDLKLAFCEECGFVFNDAFKLSKIIYNEHYDNTQSCSPMFNEYLSSLARYLIYEKNIKNCHIVEVGCGKGLFLRKLIEMDEGNHGYGFDPTYVGPLTDVNGRLHFEKSYYGPNHIGTQADVIVCRHVIEHVSNPLELLCTIRQALVQAPKARVFFETPSVEWILCNQVIWDFMYEHCSYFSPESLTTLFESTGFSVKSVQHVFGEQYLWLEATMLSSKTKLVTKNPKTIPSLAMQFAVSENKLKEIWHSKIQGLAGRGKIALWGAAGKGVTFANMIDPHCQLINCIIDINPHKQGCYLPGTGHLIIGPNDLVARDIKTVILLNPNYHNEISILLRDSNLDVKLIDLMDLNNQFIQ